jgi:hypothetical protein
MIKIIFSGGNYKERNPVIECQYFISFFYDQLQLTQNFQFKQSQGQHLNNHPVACGNGEL